MKETALMRKQAVSENAPIVKPASMGPTTRERLNCIEFKAMALERSLWPTRSRKSDWWDGVIKALEIPFRIATPATSGTRANPKPVEAARTSAQAI